MNELTIANVGIRQDAEGRYCLNDLHRAAVEAGANARTKEPAKFFASTQTAELVRELTDTQILGIAPVASIKGGLQQGTFVCKELVYAYAMWISPAFHLRVIRAYDALATQPAQPSPVDLSNPAHLRTVLLSYTEKVIELEAKVQEQAPKVEFHDAVVAAVNSQSVQEIAKVLGTGPNQLFKFLRDEGVLMRNNLPYQKHIDAGHFRVVERQYKDPSGESHTYARTLVTGKGLVFIQKLLRAHSAIWAAVSQPEMVLQ